ncbi:MAG: hypothetical protein WC222_09270 [Parachlamydiales bacterium]|jgi:hypothetical protein
METTLDSRVTVKIFIGFLVNPELKANLAHSLGWKEAAILRATDQNQLLETSYHNKSYIGFYGDDKLLTLAYIHDIQNLLRTQLHEYCPKLIGVEKMPIFVFPQIFVS